MVPNLILSDCRDNIFGLTDCVYEYRGIYCNFLAGICSLYLGTDVHHSVMGPSPRVNSSIQKQEQGISSYLTV